jgi:hypothetical protein
MSCWYIDLLINRVDVLLSIVNIIHLMYNEVNLHFGTLYIYKALISKVIHYWEGSMKKMKKFKLMAPILSACLLLILFYRVGGKVYSNHEKMDNFSYNKLMEQYQRSIPIDKMDLSEYNKYFNYVVTLQAIKVSNVIDAPKNIQYFTEQNGKKILAMKIPKGMGILWIHTEELNDIHYGYGLRSYPTYEKGWRYVKPFMLSGQKSDIEQLPYYFVRTKDLEAVGRKAIKSTSYLVNSLKSQGRTVEDGVFHFTRIIDNSFYDKGVFCSPDLKQRVWHWLDTLLLCLTAGLLVLILLIRRTACEEPKS